MGATDIWSMKASRYLPGSTVPFVIGQLFLTKHVLVFTPSPWARLSAAGIFYPKDWKNVPLERVTFSLREIETVELAPNPYAPFNSIPESIRINFDDRRDEYFLARKGGNLSAARDAILAAANRLSR